MSGKMCAKSRSHERAVIISDTGRGEVTGLTVSSMGLEVRRTRAELQLCHQVLSLEPSLSPSLASYLICEVGGGVQCPRLAGTTRAQRLAHHRPRECGEQSCPEHSVSVLTWE